MPSAESVRTPTEWPPSDLPSIIVEHDRLASSLGLRQKILRLVAASTDDDDDVNSVS